MDKLMYQRLNIQSGDLHFTIYCTVHSLEYRREAVDAWVVRLTQRLHWQVYEMTIGFAAPLEATRCKQTLFEYRFPADDNA